MKWKRVMLLVVFEEFEVVYIFFATFFFSLSLLIGKRSTLEKNWGAAAPQSPLVSTGLGMVPDTYKNIDSLYNFKKIIKNGSLKTVHVQFVSFFCQKYRVL